MLFSTFFYLMFRLAIDARLHQKTAITLLLSILHCSKGVTPRFYGLPKIHKASVPLRPIMSFINSPTYNLSKFLSRILSSLLVNRYSVRNFKEFVDYVQNFTISESEILVSFDVVSLFTSVPMDKALNLVLELFASDESLSCALLLLSLT